MNFSLSFNFDFKKDKDKFFIYDVTRRTYLLLTPEEWVRQHWVHFFLYEKGYSPSALITERKVEIYGTTKRIDLLITKKTIPQVLVECKAPQIKLSEKTFEQIARYNIEIGAPKIILSNGHHHIFAEKSEDGYVFTDFNILN